MKYDVLLENLTNSIILQSLVPIGPVLSEEIVKCEMLTPMTVRLTIGTDTKWEQKHIWPYDRWAKHGASKKWTCLRQKCTETCVFFYIFSIKSQLPEVHSFMILIKFGPQNMHVVFCRYFQMIYCSLVFKYS